MSRPHRSITLPLVLCALTTFATTIRAFDAPHTVPDVARWNDRSTPRKMLETFFFTLYCYDLSPELIVNAIDCLDLGPADPDAKERDGALTAHELGVILSRRSDLALYAVPNHPEGDRYELVHDGVHQIALAKAPDGNWRFSRATVEAIPKMRSASGDSQREAQRARGQMSEGRTDPETTVRTFLHHALVRHEFSEAAKCLDLRDVPSKFRAVRGPEMARKLMFVMQRCGFAFPQEFPSDPDGWRFIWHSNHRGRIMLDRVRTADGKDAWLFSRMTLMNLDALVDGFKSVPPDPRYARIGKVIDVNLLTSSKETVPPPKEVPGALGSPRASLRTFFQAMDELELDDSKAQTAIACLDLGDIPSADRFVTGLRAIAKLQAILRPLNLDLLSISDSWEAETVHFTPDKDSLLTLSRGSDGAWRFDQESVARIPELFDHLSKEQKTAAERRAPFHSARQTTRTLMNSVEQGDLVSAAECLDLEGIPAGARGELGPRLAYKLAYVLERLNRTSIQEIPNEADGPAFLIYRGSSGRIGLARSPDPARPADWVFTHDTVGRIDALFHSVLNSPTALGEQAATAKAGMPPGLRIKSSLPAGLRTPMLGMAVYQWLGMLLILLTSAAAAWLIAEPTISLIASLLHRGGFNLGREFVAKKLRPLGFQLGLWALYLQLPLLDLPIGVVGHALPTVKFIWVGFLGWTMFRLTDLGTGIYSNSEHLKVRNNLSDMIVPTATRLVKIMILLSTVGYQVYLIGGGEWVGKLVAGLGLVGLAASLAAQDTLKNFFGTLLLIGEHPFRIGDLIIINGMEGTVEAVGFRSTLMRTPEDSLLTVPNSVIAGTTIDNRGKRKCRRYRAMISMAYDTPLSSMNAFRDAVRAVAESRPELVRADKIDIHIHTLADSGVELLVNVFFWVVTFAEEMEARDWFNQGILSAAERLDIEIAFPTRTLHLPELALLARRDEPHSSVPAPKFANNAGSRNKT